MSWSQLSPTTQASVMSTAGNAAGALIGGGLNLGGMALQHKYNKEMADIQNQYNIDMWNRQNEYNSPTSQMNRLKEAGLNPNLMYDMGNVGNSSVAPQKVAPNAPDAQSAMRDAARAIDPVQAIQMIINLRKDLADAQSAEEKARILGIQGDIADRELFALLNPMYDIDLESGLITRKQNSDDANLTVYRYRNPYRNGRDTAGYEYFSLMNALKAQGQLSGSLQKRSQSSYSNTRTGLLNKEMNWFDVNAASKIFGQFTPVIDIILKSLLNRRY